MGRGRCNDTLSMIQMHGSELAGFCPARYLAADWLRRTPRILIRSALWYPYQALPIRVRQDLDSVVVGGDRKQWSFFVESQPGTCLQEEEGSSHESQISDSEKKRTLEPKPSYWQVDRHLHPWRSACLCYPYPKTLFGIHLRQLGSGSSSCRTGQHPLSAFWNQSTSFW